MLLTLIALGAKFAIGRMSNLRMPPSYELYIIGMMTSNSIGELMHSNSASTVLSSISERGESELSEYMVNWNVHSDSHGEEALIFV